MEENEQQSLQRLKLLLRKHDELVREREELKQNHHLKSQGIESHTFDEESIEKEAPVTNANLLTRNELQHRIQMSNVVVSKGTKTKSTLKELVKARTNLSQTSAKTHDQRQKLDNQLESLAIERAKMIAQWPTLQDKGHPELPTDSSVETQPESEPEGLQQVLKDEQLAIVVHRLFKKLIIRSGVNWVSDPELRAVVTQDSLSFD